MASNCELHLSPVEADELCRERERVAMKLLKLALAQERVSACLSKNLQPGTQRASIVCPVEIMRGREIIFREIGKWRTAKNDLTTYFVSWALPKDRLGLGHLSKLDPQKLKRRWRRRILKLFATGVQVQAICVVEVGVIRLVTGEVRYEPHVHFLIRGPSPSDIKRAFASRKNASATDRLRALHIEQVDDIDRTVGYLAKFRGQLRSQYRTAEGELRTRPNRLPDDIAREWYDFFLDVKIADLVTSYGVDLRGLGQVGLVEMSAGRR